MHASKVVRLIYTNSGVAVLALASITVHKLCKWQRSDRNPSGMSTASIPPQMWQLASGIVMNNDIGDTNPEETAACISLSKNDSYVMSASGGKVSLFNMMTFKVYPSHWFHDNFHATSSCSQFSGFPPSGQ